jgi:hypothetical protein
MASKLMFLRDTYLEQVVRAATIAAYFVVPDSPVRSPGRISWMSAILLSAWLVALLLALSEAPHWGWRSDKVIGLLIAAVVLVVAWADPPSSMLQLR